MILGGAPYEQAVADNAKKFTPPWIRSLNQAQSILQAVQLYGEPQFATISEGSSTQISANVGVLQLRPTTALASAAVVLPTGPVDKQQIQITTTQKITTLNIQSASGTNVTGQPGGLGAGTSVVYYYVKGDLTWYMIEDGGTSSSSSTTTGGLNWLLYGANTFNTSVSDPNPGNMSWNTITQESATALCFSHNVSGSRSVAALFSGLPPAGYLYIQQSSNANNWQLFKWTAVTDNTAYLSMTVSILGWSGNRIDALSTVLVAFGPYTPVPSGGLSNAVLAKSSATDYNYAWTGLSTLLDAVFGNTQGQILLRSTSAWTVLNPGTSGQFLQTAGTGANPLWATVLLGGFSFQSTAPSSPTVGDRWVDSNTGIEYTYMNDGNSSQWVEF